MIVLAGADLVLPDRVLTGASLVIDGGVIAAIEPDIIAPAGAAFVDAGGMTIVSGFIDVHVHGVEGIDVLDGGDAVARVAARLPKYGVASFCPTSVACSPHELDDLLGAVEAAAHGADGSARVLPAHLESNFINSEYNGAQPLSCIRTPRGAAPAVDGSYTGGEILQVIARRRASVAIVTLAPEIEGGLELVAELVQAGHRVSIGHSGATYEQTREAIDAGVTQATHLFNRMSPMTHRAPGVPGAVLESDAVTAEIICDGFHVHPALVQIAFNAKGARRIMAITDGTAGSGLPVGSRTRLGGRPIVVTERTAELEDGTLAGSVLTMDGAFRTLVHRLGVPLAAAARACATTPADQLGLSDAGRLEVGCRADLVVLDADLRVQQTFIAGKCVWDRNASPAPLV